VSETKIVFKTDGVEEMLLRVDPEGRAFVFDRSGTAHEIDVDDLVKAVDTAKRAKADLPKS
jgi:hypothetical protein